MFLIFSLLIHSFNHPNSYIHRVVHQLYALQHIYGSHMYWQLKWAHLSLSHCANDSLCIQFDALANWIPPWGHYVCNTGSVGENWRRWWKTKNKIRIPIVLLWYSGNLVKQNKQIACKVDWNERFARSMISLHIAIWFVDWMLMRIWSYNFSVKLNTVLFQFSSHKKTRK